MNEPIAVRQIELRDLMIHEHTTIDLPERGIVLVTGPNGSGKSSLIEGVAVALWGKTLRGTPAWADGAKMSLSRTKLANGMCVDRFRTGARGRVELDFYQDGTKDHTRRIFETTSKAQDALEDIVGPFDVWRRGHVFSSADAAHFSLASDGERKRLLESMLGIDNFDNALEDCRKDLRTASSACVKCRSAISVTEAKLESERMRLADAEKHLASVSEPSAVGVGYVALGSLTALEKDIADTQQAIQKAQHRLRIADRAGVQHDAEAKQCDATLDKLHDLTCPTCNQAIPPELREQLRIQASAARGRASAAREEAHASCSGVQDELLDLEGELSELQAQRARLSEAQTRERLASTARKEREKRIEQARQTVDTARTRIAELEANLVDAQAKYAAKIVEVETLTAVESVLGLRGVRANILSRALGGLDIVTNSWLVRLGLSGLSARLRSYSEKKSGGVTDAISIEVLGAGGGHGYKATSAGERRRIDLALMLAIAEIAAAAQGRKVGTLFFDETFDHLDVSGVQALLAALDDLSRERCVVVITHSDILARAVRPVRRIELADGLVITDGDIEAAKATDTVRRLQDASSE